MLQWIIIIGIKIVHDIWQNRRCCVTKQSMLYDKTVDAIWQNSRCYMTKQSMLYDKTVDDIWQNKCWAYVDWWKKYLNHKLTRACLRVLNQLLPEYIKEGNVNTAIRIWCTRSVHIDNTKTIKYLTKTFGSQQECRQTIAESVVC